MTQWAGLEHSKALRAIIKKPRSKSLVDDSTLLFHPGRTELVNKLAFAFNLPHAFSSVSVLAHAPTASGVYGISNAREWLYIGEAENIQQRLLVHLSESGTALHARSPTGFSFELCDENTRHGRQDRLIMQYEPVCNRQSPSGPERKF